MFKYIALVLIAVLALAPVAIEAQQASPGAAVTQTGSTGLAAGNCLSSVGTSSVAITLTVPAPGGSNSVYIDFLTLAVDSTAAVTPGTALISWSSTNIGGTPSFPVNRLISTSAAQVAFGANGPLVIPIKALAGVGPTFVSPAANAAFFGTGTVCWHVAP